MVQHVAVYTVDGKRIAARPEATDMPDDLRQLSSRVGGKSNTPFDVELSGRPMRAVLVSSRALKGRLWYMRSPGRNSTKSSNPVRVSLRGCSSGRWGSSCSPLGGSVEGWRRTSIASLPLRDELRLESSRRAQAPPV
ncbi:MAG: hypothetical protein QM784_33350 [Polyangiaceae bacterium]